MGDFQGTRRYQVLGLLGTGGMGVVYEAVDRESGREVALKRLHESHRVQVSRFKRDLDVLKQVDHPNLVRLGDLFEEDGAWFLTMELVDGSHFLRHVRPNGRVHEARLRDALVQLARGTSALHEAGKVHRDIKPSNILVTEQGRVVLLDFGLVADAYEQDGIHGHAAGTAEYMAPEQAGRLQVGPAADWYSVGVVLYEALAGAPPFTGPASEVLLKKQTTEPAPGWVKGQVPEDLERLCLELLRIDPRARPSGAKVLRRLGDKQPGLHALSTHALAPPFVGRREELAFLRRAFDEIRGGQPITVHVHGESGLGKTSLVQRFVDLTVEESNAVVLHGRCSERQEVQGKLMDSLVGALGAYLERLPKEEVVPLLPRSAGLLRQAFRPLCAVAAIAEAPVIEIVDPQELRSRVFAALRELLLRLSGQRPTIIFIDDFQRVDEDSLALVGEILRPPSAPPLLIVTTSRAAETGSRALFERYSRLPGESRILELAPLSAEDAWSLASALLDRVAQGSEIAERRAEEIAEAAGRHPLVIAELVRQSVLQEGESPARFEDAISARVQRMDPRALSVLKVVMVAGQPLDRETIAQVTGHAPLDMDRALSTLCLASLAHVSDAMGMTMVSAPHDRIRSAVTACIPGDEQRECHLELARVLEASGKADPEDLAIHFKAAGKTELAIEHATKAAERASRSLAFDRAVRWYRMAIELQREAGPVARKLMVALAESLANAGSGVDAAEAFTQAAEGASEAETLELRTRSAQQLLVTGHIDDGISRLREIVESEGMSYPKTPARALAMVLMRRARLAIRGIGFRETSASQLSAKALARIDACYHVGMSLAIVDNIRGSALMTQSLLLALNAGERYRVARSIAIEAGFQSTRGRRSITRTIELLDIGSELATKSSNHHLVGFIRGTRGQAEYLWGRFRAAVQYCKEAEAILRERFSGVPWELAVVRLWRCRGLLYLGQVQELATQATGLLDDCLSRNDRYGETTLRVSVSPFLRLVGGDPEGARKEITDSLARWSPSGFHVQHYYALTWRVAADLYAGDHGAAISAMADSWPALRRSLLLRVQFIRCVVSDLQGRVAIAAATRATGSARKHLLADANRIARHIAKERMPWCEPLGILIRAGVAAVGGDLESAAAHLRLAAKGFDAAEMALHAAAARYRLGEHLGGDEGRALVTQAHSWMTEQGIQEPERMTALLAPGRAG
ncbi:MAG: protein kinase [Deltaproteobacteria bacterium]|nr:protein kinase [Deltaproteobacteria bacterium]